MALDPDAPYDVLAINAASLSTQLSGLPFSGPVGGVRVALIEGQWVAFPTPQPARGRRLRHGRRRPGHRDRRRRDHDGRGRGHRADLGPGPVRRPGADRGGRGRRPRRRQAVHQAARARRRPSWPTQAAKPVQEFPVFLDYEDDVYAAVEAAAKADLAAAMTIAGKQEREAQARRDQGRRCSSSSPAEFEGREKEIGAAFRSLTKQLVRERVLRDKVRIDGRGLADIRPLHAEVGVIPRVHGSALFERGETQILGVTTLNMLTMEQKLDTLSPEKTRRYMHKYVFPPFSTGETGRVGSPKRREVGHGALAAPRAAAGAADARGVPLRDPPALRGDGLQRLHLDGLGLRLDACRCSRPVSRCKAAVAGIAMGLISGEVDGETQYVALTDILGAEDAFGDMDFKVAGTREFVTALQLDTKLDGIPAEVLAAALTQARDARLAILDVMAEAIDAPEEMSLHAPRIITVQDPGRQDRRGHRPQGQGDQPDPGRHRRARSRIEDDGTIYIGADQRRGRRGGPADRQRDRQPDDAGGRRALPRHGREDDQLRCVRLAAPGQGRPAAHQQAARPRRWQARRGRRGRRLGRPEDPGRRSPRSTTAASCR